jgi:hypothetical protein
MRLMYNGLLLFLSLGVRPCTVRHLLQKCYSIRFDIQFDPIFDSIRFQIQFHLLFLLCCSSHAMQPMDIYQVCNETDVFLSLGVRPCTARRLLFNSV